MKTAFPTALFASLALAGCCTSLYTPDASRIDGQEWGDTSVCGIFSGWGTAQQPQRSEALYTPVTVANYTSYLCGSVDIQDFATCANRVERFYRESVDTAVQPGESTSGPFAVLLGNELYLGSYRSDPFSASFRVTSGADSCTGSYNAIHGDQEARFTVRCDKGARGTARIVPDRYGRDGIGVLVLDDGSEGKIVFGPGIAELARTRDHAFARPAR